MVAESVMILVMVSVMATERRAEAFGSLRCSAEIDSDLKYIPAPHRIAARSLCDRAAMRGCGVCRTSRRYAANRSVGHRRIGLPPGGLGGSRSRSDNASRISSIDTGFFRPSGERSAGHEAMADASDAHDARMARL